MASRILILEDDPETSLLLERCLAANKYEAVKATRVGEAENVLFSSPVDLVFADRMLPDRDGLEFVKSIKQLPCFRYIGIVFLSAKNMLKDKLEGLSGGGDDYVTKPFSPEELISRTKAVLKFVSPMLHPASHLPGPLACEKEIGLLTEKDDVKFYTLVLGGFERFKGLFPDRIPPLMDGLSEAFYREMAKFKMADFISHIQDDCFLLMAREGRGEMLLDRFKKGFEPVRKRLLRQSALDFFKTPPEDLLNLRGGELQVQKPKITYEKVIEKLREYKKSLEPSTSRNPVNP